MSDITTPNAPPADAPGPITGPRRTVVIRHNRIELALHHLRGARDGGAPARQAFDGGARGGARDRADGPGDGDGDGDGRALPLLHLHGLGERSPERVPGRLATWPGPVWALDFTGHGASTVPRGGGYSCELLMGDADAALAEIGPAAVYGRGLGGYVALLVAGARPDEVRGAVVDDGAGLTGGGSEPPTPFVLTRPVEVTGPPDPYALLELSGDVRPPDYAATYARQAVTLSGLEVAVAVAARVRPPWLEAVVAVPGVRELAADEALAVLASPPGA